MTRAEPKTLSATQVPVIDISPLYAGGDPTAVARELYRAATEVGFIYVRGHGISRETIARTREHGFRFFRLPAEEKAKSATNSYHHGYLRPGGSKMYDDAKVDLKESFLWGVELDDAAYAAARDNPMLGPNVWPAALPDFKDGVYPFLPAAQTCAEHILRAFAIGAGLPADTFLKHTDRPVSRGSIQYYPPQPADSNGEQFGVAPHTDFGVLTVLCQDEVGGLQIQDLHGDWLAVPPIPDTLVINVGDLLERWSNGVYRSTPHRVINASGRERMSLVVGYDPNYESLVDPAVMCRDADDEPKYQPITVGDYLMWRFEKAFAYRKADGGETHAH